MFTGIVREVGEVADVREGRLCILTALTVPSGGSVAVNGACLTVVEAAPRELRFDTVPETLQRTNLGRLHAGARVNLEPALTLDDALDGHLVQGHVDATVRVLQVGDVELGKEVSFELPPDLRRYVAEKGSIAIDGTSLTITGVSNTAFSVALIPHTLHNTIAGAYTEGTVVNLEVDVVARYIERLLNRNRGQ